MRASVLQLAARRRMTRRGRSAGGFTVTEVLVAALLTGLLLLAAMRWVIGLVDVAATHADLEQPRATARFVVDQFDRDLADAAVCAANGLGAPVAYADDQLLAVYVDDTRDGQLEQVWWRYDVHLAVLERAVVADAGCTPTEPDGGWVTVAATTDRPADGQATFGYLGGDDGHRGACEGVGAAGCLYDAVTLTVTPVAPVTRAPAAARATVPLDTSESRLR